MLPRRAPLPLPALTVSLFLLGCGDVVPPVAVLVEGEYGISGIAVDESSVYFIKKDGTLKSVSIDGGPAEEIASGITDPRQIAVDQTDVYWATSTGTIARTAKRGGASAEPLIENSIDLGEIALDPTHLYFTVSGNNGFVRRISKTGGETEPLLENVSDPEQEDTGLALAHHGGFLYWVQNSAEVSALRRMAIDGTGLTPLSATAPTAQAVAADPSFVYWTSFGDGTVTRASPDGSDVRIVAYDQPQLFKVLGDGANVYWSSLDGSIATVPVSGGAEPFVLSTGPKGPVFLAQDEGFLYSARFETGTILVRPKPEGPYE